MINAKNTSDPPASEAARAQQLSDKQLSGINGGATGLPEQCAAINSGDTRGGIPSPVDPFGAMRSTPEPYTTIGQGLFVNCSPFDEN